MTFDDDASHNVGKIPDITAQMAEGHNVANLEQPIGLLDAGASQHKLPKLKWKKMAVNELQKVSCQRLPLFRRWPPPLPLQGPHVCCMLECPLMQGTEL